MNSKLLSARFWTIMLVTITYCFIVGFTCVVYVKTVTPDKLEGFSMGLVMGFAGFAVKALIEYFGKDRTAQGGSNEQK